MCAGSLIEMDYYGERLLAPRYPHPAIVLPNDAGQVGGPIEPKFKFGGHAKRCRQEQERTVGGQVTHRAINR